MLDVCLVFLGLHMNPWGNRGGVVWWAAGYSVDGGRVSNRVAKSRNNSSFGIGILFDTDSEIGSGMVNLFR